MPGLVVVGSTRGSVLRLAHHESALVRESLSAVLVDRECGMAEFAREAGVELRHFSGTTNAELSDSLADQLAELDPDVVVLFYTRLLTGRVLREYEGRLLNFHPSLLPRHPGLDGFEKTLAAEDEWLGATVHLVSEELDAGRILLQTSAPNDSQVAVSERRHLVFRAQVAQFKVVAELVADASMRHALMLAEPMVAQPTAARAG